MNDQEREEALRRLMADAVEPLHPAPDSQARLMARIEAAEDNAQQRAGNGGGGKPKSSRWRVSPAGLGWSGVGLSAAAVVAAAVFFATHSSRTNNSGASSGSSVAAAPSQASSQAAAGSASEPAPVPKQPLSRPLVVNDLDGDGTSDVFTLNGSTLSARLSREGQQQVTLPATGSGAQVLGVTLLQTPAGGRVPVVLVRLQSRPGFAQDAAAALVDGRLTVLRIGSQPAVLTVDATRGYACSDGELAVAGNPVAYTVQGAQLVASPRLRAVDVPPGQASGC
jgi:hypothetical protein